MRNILLIIIISFQCLYSQTIIERVSVNPLYRANIYLSAIPESYQSHLSPDKRKVVVTINNAKVPESERKHRSSGVIRDIYIQSLGKNIEISVILNEPRGYTAVILPYSKALAIEVFNWDRLSPAEEHYRTGLLALENKIESAMQKELVEASNSGNADAAAFLAFSELSKGNILNAIDNLKLSALKTSIPDVFAAISHVYSLANANAQSQKYETYFKKLTGLNYYDKIVLNYTDELNKFKAAPNIYIEKLDELVINDSLFMLSDSSYKTDSSELSRFHELFANNNARSDNKNISGNNSSQKSIMPEWFGLAAFISVVLIIISGFIIGIAYIKWRNNRIKSLKKDSDVTKETKKSEINDNDKKVKDVGSALRTKAIEAYSSKQQRFDKEHESEGTTHIITSEKQREKLHQILSKMSEDEVNITKLESDAPNFENITQSDNKDIEGKFDLENQNFINPAGASKAQMEFAKTLNNELHKIKGKNIESITKNEINIDEADVTEVAKKLGIEQENINIKKVIDDEENPSIKELKEKLKGYD